LTLKKILKERGEISDQGNSFLHGKQSWDAEPFRGKVDFGPMGPIQNWTSLISKTSSILSVNRKKNFNQKDSNCIF